MTDDHPDPHLSGQRLAARAAAVDPRPDWDDLSRRLATVTGAGCGRWAGLAVAGAGGRGAPAGFAAGRAGTERPREVATGPVPTAPTPIGTTPVPVVPRASGTAVRGRPPRGPDGDGADASVLVFDGGCRRRHARWAGCSSAPPPMAW